MNKKIATGALGGLLLFTGAANAAFQQLGTADSWISTIGTAAATANNLEGLNTLYQQTPTQDPRHELVQFSSAGADPTIANIHGATGFVENQVDPLTTLVDQITLFANDAGSLLPGTNLFGATQFTHTDFFLLNNTGSDFTITFDWEVVNGNGVSFFTNPFGPTAGDPLDVFGAQLNGVGLESGTLTMDILNGDTFGLSLLTDIGFISGPTNIASANIFNLRIDEERPVDVPEPGTLLLLAAGLAGLGVTRRRQKIS